MTTKKTDLSACENEKELNLIKNTHGLKQITNNITIYNNIVQQRSFIKFVTQCTKYEGTFD